MGTLVVLAWPQTLVRPQGFWYDVPPRWLGLQRDGFYMAGHGGMLLIGERGGRVRYFDFGRYHLLGQMGRLRGDDTDPELAVRTSAVVGPDGEVLNIEQVLLEVSRIEATHGMGRLVASVFRGIDEDAASRRCLAVQEAGALPFRHFDPRGTNCARMIARIAATGRPSPLARLVLAAAWLVSPSALLLARVLNDRGVLFVVDGGKIERRGPWARLGPWPWPKVGDAARRGEGSFLAPPRAPCLAPEARWLPGVAFGTWFALSREEGLAAREFRVRRWSASGVLECDRVFTLRDGDSLDPREPYEFSYPSHCLRCSVRQGGRLAELRFVREYPSA